MLKGFPKFGSMALLTLGLVLLLPPVLHAQSASFNPFADRAAQLKEASGSISFLKDGNPWALNIGDFVQVRQTIITGADGYGKFQVTDGSTFEVFPNSRLVFRVNPSSTKDLLDLYLGKVKVHIEKMMGGKPNPNTVNTPTAIISVRGTTFSVEAGDDTTQVSVEEGVVDVIHAIYRSSPKTLYGGDSITVYKNQDLAKASIDKGGIAQKVLNTLGRAAIQLGQQLPRGGSGGSSPTGGGGPTAGNGGGLPTDKGKPEGGTTPAPPPPPPPPPPPGA